jgi:hypothetical protein
MATTSGNNVVKPGKVLEYPVTKSGSVDFNQGDLVYSNSGIATAATTADTHTQYLIGVALTANPIDPTVYGDAVYPTYAEIGYGGVYKFKTTASESYTHDALVNVGADSQTVTMTAGSYPVGRVYNPEGTTITGASGVTVNVRIFNWSQAGAKLI